jgi:hypothetical protein
MQREDQGNSDLIDILFSVKLADSSITYQALPVLQLEDMCPRLPFPHLSVESLIGQGAKQRER